MYGMISDWRAILKQAKGAGRRSVNIKTSSEEESSILSDQQQMASSLTFLQMEKDMPKMRERDGDRLLGKEMD